MTDVLTSLCSLEAKGITMRKQLALALTAATLLAGACTAGDQGDDTEGGAPATSAAPDAPPPTGPAPGVTDDSIKVGVTYLDVAAIAEVVDIDQGDYEAAYTALFDDINANGGINGRTVEAVFQPVSPIGTESAQAACVELTEDEDVFLAMGFFRTDEPACYVDTHQTALLGGYMANHLLDRSTVPWFSPDAGEDFQGDAIRRFAEDGLFGDHLGVFAITTEADLMEDVALPALEEAGIEPVDTAILDAPPDDVTAQNAAVGVIAERFRSAGIDQVLIIGSGGLTWANGVQSLDYRPQLLITDKGPIDAFTASPGDPDLSLLAGAIGGSVDVPPPDAYDTPEMQECLAVQEAAGYPSPDPATLPPERQGEVAAAFISCAQVALFRAIVEGAGEELNYGTLQEAGEQLGELRLPGKPDPYHFGPPPSADGDPVVQVFEWNAEDETFDLRDEG
jgi:hypothetical protein